MLCAVINESFIHFIGEYIYFLLHCEPGDSLQCFLINDRAGGIVGRIENNHPGLIIDELFQVFQGELLVFHPEEHRFSPCQLYLLQVTDPVG